MRFTLLLLLIAGVGCGKPKEQPNPLTSPDMQAFIAKARTKHLVTEFWCYSDGRCYAEARRSDTRRPAWVAGGTGLDEAARTAAIELDGPPILVDSPVDSLTETYHSGEIK